MEEKLIRLIIYYVISVYDNDKKTKNSCNEIANLLLSMVKNEETKADRLLNTFPSNHPVSLIYLELRENSRETIIEGLEKAIELIDKYKFQENYLVNIEDDIEVEELSRKISKM